MTYSGPSLLSFTGAALSAVHFRMAEAAASGHMAAARGFVLCMNVFYLGRLLGESSRFIQGAIAHDVALTRCAFTKDIAGSNVISVGTNDSL